MPNFDGGHYFFTALIPIKKGQIEDGGVYTSPVHALRKVLALLPASPTLRFPTEPSPFAQVPGLHFARLAIVDDVAYNGRVGSDPIVDSIRVKWNPVAGNPINPQLQDHLPRPYLLVAMDFDAADGLDLTRDRFLETAWNLLSADITSVLRYAVGFDKVRQDANGFATYMAECQIETTMSFNDYYIAEKLELPNWISGPAGKAAIVFAIVSVAALGIAVVELLIGVRWPHFLPSVSVLFLLGLLILVGAAFFAFVTITRQGEAAFPTDPRTTLPNILKALYLQRAFTEFAIANQVNAANAAGAAALHAAFGAFLDTQRPKDLAHPTQSAGDLGI